ncbi:hypothetical protein BJX63DRAFT_400266 [Aspergillus granulosus]|uniref:FAD-binding domain-containing protein n=1 Tax=Aspergillus granulosus TaxID=176169 RepID=A0ABR4H6E5_9EURO
MPTKLAPNHPLRPCHVLIAGGGIAGLTLALVLETHGIPYTLLEAYPEIIPKTGAGICLLPNGLRILDQVGCYDDLRSRVGEDNLMENVYLRDEDGKALHYSDGWTERMVERWGYAGLWCDRSMLLQTLYDHIVDKSRLLTSKRVTNTRHLEDSIEVTTTDGSIYTGDILVGTDGTHSRVREEMVRYANELGIGDDYTDSDEVSATYACLFGLSTPSRAMPRGLLSWNLGHGYAYAIGTGPENRTYWLLAKHMGTTYQGSEIPRLTDEDRERIVREHWDNPITEEVRMKDLYESRLDLVMTPLREIVYKRWDCGRMVVLGDAGHKMLPIIAQGGNQAIETVAAFTNGLVSALSAQPSSTTPLSQEEITAVLRTFQASRIERVSKIVEIGQQRQKMDTLSSPEMEELMLKKFPALLPGVLVSRWDQSFPKAVSLGGLERPFRKKEVPFEDEKLEEEM